MQQSQQKADNLGFYLHKYEAEKIFDLVGRERLKKEYGRYQLILTDYLIQSGKRSEARKVMYDYAMEGGLNISVDTMLWLDYLCHQAEVNLRPYNVTANKESILNGYDCLIQCYIISTRKGISYYKGCSMKILSKYLLNDSVFTLVRQSDPASLRYVNEEAVADTMLAGNLAERALCEFLEQNDTYQTADAWRNLAMCFFVIGNAERSVEYLHMALANPAVDSIPALKANILQQMSMSYAALDDKNRSDQYRNEYLDIQDNIRQDRQYEARAMELENSTWRIVKSATMVFIAALVLCGLTLFVNILRKRREMRKRARNSELEKLEENIAVESLREREEGRIAIEQRAKISVLTAMIPFIDRLKLAVRNGQLDYAHELISEIQQQNNRLTEWIKLRRGKITLRVETFNMATVLNIVAQAKGTLERQNVTLDIRDTDAFVKADKILTVFILNTLIENSRKAIDKKPGNIVLECEKHQEEGFAEIIVRDNGKGMTEEQAEQLFLYKQIKDEGTGDETSHGFGLQNCYGIIERYKKVSSAFSVCKIWVKSTLGKGTSIGFRLPLVVKTMLMFLGMAGSLNAANIDSYADSLYNCNVAGKHAEAICYADSCEMLMKKGEKTDSIVMLSIYNETAVASLAVHDWKRYRLANYNYTTLYQQITADNSLAGYCEKLEKNKRKANGMMLVSIMVLLMIIPMFWYVYLRHVMKERKDLFEGIQKAKELLHLKQIRHNTLHVYNNITDNQLSTVKHETMYYPARIEQMIRMKSDGEEMMRVVNYYEELYSLLSKAMLTDNTKQLLFPVKQYKVSEVLPISRQDDVVICNKELMDYLLYMFKQHNDGLEPEYDYERRRDGYCEIRTRLNSRNKDNCKAEDLFTTANSDVDYLVMRQVIREIGNGSMRYGCGIKAENKDNETLITFSLPLMVDDKKK